MADKPNIETLGSLRASGYISKNIKDELRDNLKIKFVIKSLYLRGFSDMKIRLFLN